MRLPRPRFTVRTLMLPVAPDPPEPKLPGALDPPGPD